MKKVEKDKQRSTKHTYKTKDRVTQTPLKPGIKSGAPEGWAVQDLNHSIIQVRVLAPIFALPLSVSTAELVGSTFELNR